jgi:hypothetical protein
MSDEPHSTAEPFAAVAVALATQGWAVFPLAPRGQKPLAGSRGHLEATTDLDQVLWWAQRHPQSNVGVRPGPAQCVIDVDNPAEFAAWRREHQLRELPTTRTVRTRSGAHHYFELREPVKLRNGPAGVFDVKTNTGYVCGPGSIHPTGKLYRLAVGGPAATLPGPWVEALRRRQSQARPSPFTAGLPEAVPNPKMVATLGLYKTGRREAFKQRVVSAYTRYLAHPRLLAELEREALRIGIRGGEQTTAELLAWAAATLTPNWDPNLADPLPPEYLR